MSELAARQADCFYFNALEPRFFSRDRTYRVYVCDNKLVGVYIAGQFHDEWSAWAAFNQAWPVMAPFVRR